MRHLSKKSMFLLSITMKDLGWKLKSSANKSKTECLGFFSSSVVNLQSVFCVLIVIFKPEGLWEASSMLFTALLIFSAGRNNIQGVGWAGEGNLSSVSVFHSSPELCLSNILHVVPKRVQCYPKQSRPSEQQLPTQTCPCRSLLTHRVPPDTPCTLPLEQCRVQIQAF